MNQRQPLLIQTDGLGRRFGRKAAVRDVSFTLEPGRIVALLGENGAGKSTLLNLIAGCYEPSEGSATVLGHAVRAARQPDHACMIDGHVPPDWATPKFLIDLQAEAAPRFDRDQALELLRKHGIDLQSRFGSLSKGQKRWLLVVLTMASNARVVLMDEPADGLDTGSRRALYDALRDLVNEGESSAVVATHIIDDIDRVADAVAVISAGRLVLYEDLEDLREQVREVELPLESPFRETDGIDLVGSQTVGGVQLCTVKCTGGDREIEQKITAALSINPVRLEDLYLKLTGNKNESQPNGTTQL